MFSRKQTSSADLRGPIRAIQQGSGLRGEALVLASLPMILLACAAPACRANTNNNAASDGTVNTVANVATDARQITPPAGTEIAANSKTASSGGTPTLLSSDFLTPFHDPGSLSLRSDRKSGDPAFSAQCLHIPAGFCRVFNNKQIVILGAAQT